MAALKYEMEMKLMEAKKRWKKKWKTKLLPRLKQHLNLNYDYSVAGSKENIDYGKTSDETFSNVETSEIHYAEDIDKVKTDLEQKLMDNERKMRDEMAIELEKKN